MKKTPIKIGSHLIGPGRKVFIIAEIGINHNGDVDLARRSILAARNAGADCVKFQTFRSEEFMSDEPVEYTYFSAGKSVTEDMKAMFRRVELPFEAYRDIFQYARENGIEPLSSPADPLSVDWLVEIGSNALKLASEDLINWKLLEYVNRQNLPIILSTGMAEEWEVEKALKILADVPVILCHCVSLYPVPDNELNLRRMSSLRKFTRNVGYSDHSAEDISALGAVAMGATVIEKHFTLNRDLHGPDHSMSYDPEMLGRYIKGIRAMEMALGSELIEPSTTEKEARKKFRRSLVAVRDMDIGEVVAPEDICLKRPHTGLHPYAWEEIVGKSLLYPIRKDELFREDHFENLQLNSFRPRKEHP